MSYSDIEQYIKEYQENGYVCLRDIISEGNSLLLCDKVFRMLDKNLAIQRNIATRPSISLLDGGGLHKYEILPGTYFRSWAPEFLVLYEALAPFFSAITKLNLITSPYEESSINAMIYRGDNSQCPQHFDSNKVTFLLYLTSTKSGKTSIRGLKIGDMKMIQPVAGSGLLFDGRGIWHGSLPMKNNEIKVAVTFNYYTDYEQLRLSEMDNHSYGEKKIA